MTEYLDKDGLEYYTELVKDKMVFDSSEEAGSIPTHTAIHWEEATGTPRLLNEIVVDLIYPVGSIYISVNSTNPSVLFGGTWVAWGAGKVPVGVDTSQTEFNTVEKTGGEKTHTLTVAEMPSHSHNWKATNLGASGDNYAGIAYNNYSGHAGQNPMTEWIYNTGGDQAHNNLQPYITCYMWKRTA